MTEQILLLENVHKSIKKKEIVKGISFGVNEGEVLGFLGPNGAGKSTTLRMIVGLSRPTSGKIEICGDSISSNYEKALSNVGCMIEGPDFYNYMSGMDNIKMFAAMNKNVTKDDIDYAIKLVDLQNRMKDKVGTYSLGMKQRLGLAQALIHHPKLLVLDEPTNGLDPAGISEFRQIIKNLASKEKIGVLVSSHLISEVELICNKVAIIKNGVILKYAPVSELLNTQEVFWVLDDNDKGIGVLKHLWQIDGEIIHGRIQAKINLSNLAAINTSLIREGLSLHFVENRHKTLEDFFLDITEGINIIK